MADCGFPLADGFALVRNPVLGVLLPSGPAAVGVAAGGSIPFVGVWSVCDSSECWAAAVAGSTESFGGFCHGPLVKIVVPTTVNSANNNKKRATGASRSAMLVRGIANGLVPGSIGDLPRGACACPR